MKKVKLQIEYVKPSTLKEYKNNAREHHEADVNAIAASITEFGFNDPIGVWQDEIVEGHGRLLAAIQLGLKEVPIIRLDTLTDEQRKAYALAHNKTAELSNWNFDLLESELAELGNIDMSQFGFNDNAFDDESKLKMQQEIDVEKNGKQEKECECPACGFRFIP